jgi:hypothetical protein
MLADYEDEVAHAFHAGNMANVTANAGFGMYGASLVVYFLFLKYSHQPGQPVSHEALQAIVLGVATLFAFVLLPILVLVPVQILRWRRRFGGLRAGHADLVAARMLTVKARNKWIALSIIWFHVNLVPALLLLGYSIGVLHGG